MRRFDMVILLALLFLVIPAVGYAQEVTPDSEVIVEPELTDFDASNFEHSTTIDNEWMPLEPGSSRAYEGFTVADGEKVPRRLEFVVTDLTKVIEGVRTVVAWVVDISDNEVVEKEIAFYAQDNDGNVWYFGEYPEEYENGELVDAPFWIAGLDEAKPGVKMWAEPHLGTPSYFQGWGPAVEWSDYGTVDQVGQSICVPVACYEDVLVIAESSLEEGGAFQLKYYGRGAGEIRVDWRGSDTSQERLELVDAINLEPAALEQVHSEALEMDKRLSMAAETLPAE